MTWFHDGDTRIEILPGARRITAFRSELDEFRVLTGQFDDVTTSVPRLLLWAAMSSELPVVLTLHRSGALFGIVLMTIRRWRGIPIGLAKAGNLAGQGSVVAAPVDRLIALELAARTLLRTCLVHTVVVSSLQAPSVTPAIRSQVCGMNGQWHFREVRMRLSLAEGLPAVLQQLSYKMRRNVRYYRRRAEAELGVKLIPEMTGPQRRMAVMALHASGPYPVDAARAGRMDAALQAMPGHFAMGLQDAGGNWISYVTGWRGTDATYVDWQLNCHRHEAASISTVMRAFLLEHEAARGSGAIVFVGLTNPFWARACEPQICADLIATRTGFVGAAARHLAVRLSPNGQVAALLTLSD